MQSCYSDHKNDLYCFVQLTCSVTKCHQLISNDTREARVYLLTNNIIFDLDRLGRRSLGGGVSDAPMNGRAYVGLIRQVGTHGEHSSEAPGRCS